MGQWHKCPHSKNRTGRKVKEKHDNIRIRTSSKTCLPQSRATQRVAEAQRRPNIEPLRPGELMPIRIEDSACTHLDGFSAPLRLCGICI
jgi:hypothetical protein